MPTKPLILIIDDVLENVEVLGETLSGAYDIQFATSGEKGLALVRKRRPDLVLLDVMMPGMDGYEVFDALKKDPLTESVPVIFVTAKNDARSESDALSAGAVDFIHKPINPDVVRARVKLQLELVRHRESLEKLVLKRTQELATARSEAESANAVKTRFMANVSHEMRTPLQSILGFSEMGLRRAATATPEKVADYFTHISISGKRMATLVESLLTLVGKTLVEYSAISGDQLQDINTRMFVDEIGELMSLRAEKRQQKLRLDVQGAASFQGDPERLRQVVEHLLANAIDYSAVGSQIVLRVLDSTLAGQAAIAFQVIDSGCGIPEKELTAIFEPFYQSTRTASGAGGTGLGLPLSRSIVSKHGGKLTLANRPEGGVIAEMLLPLENGASWSYAI